MKLISYSVNNNKFILLENIVIKIFKNTYNIYLNDSLYYSYNKKYFLEFIKENYKKYYDKINNLLSNKIKGGSDITTIITNAQDTIEKGLSGTDIINKDKPEAGTPGEGTPGESTPENSAPKNSASEESKNTSGQELNEIIEDSNKNYYLFIFKILLIINKIIHTDINIDTYVNEIYNEIIKKNTNLVFTEQYLLKKLNKKIRNSVDTKNICKSEEGEKILKKYIPNSDTPPGSDINTIIDNSLLLEKIKNNIDSSDIKNENEVHFQYIFNIKEEGFLWDGNIDEFLDKIFTSTKMKQNLDEFDNIIKLNLNNNLKNTKGTLKSANSGFLWDKSTWDNKILNTNLTEEIKNKYFIKTKYNIYSKQFETTVKFSKTEFDDFFNKGVNKLASDELNNEQLSDYMKNLDVFLSELLNKLIKKKMEDYISDSNKNTADNTPVDTSAENTPEDNSSILPTFSWDSYDESYKKDMSEKVKKMYFKHVDTNNLSMFNFIDLENTNTRLLKNLIEDEEKNQTETVAAKIAATIPPTPAETALSTPLTNPLTNSLLGGDTTNHFVKLYENKEDTFIDELLAIKFSKCSDIDISQCNKKTVNSVCELVKYRDFKKLPKNFLEDFEYKRKLESDDKNSKMATLGLILKNITEKIYMKTKELKLNLSNVFIESISKNIKKHLKNTLYSFKFDMIYSEDYLRKQIEDIKIKIDELSKFLNNDIITISDLIKIDKNLEDFKIIVNKPDTSWASWNPLSSSYSEQQINLKKEYLNSILLYTIKLNHVDIFKQNLMWTLHSKFLIYHLFKCIEKKEIKSELNGSDILKNIKTKILAKIEILKKFIMDDSSNDEKINLNIFDLVNPKKIAKLKLQTSTDSQFINSSLSSQNSDDKKYKSLEELEELIFKTKILTDTNEDFLNNIMFFYKKTNDNNWDILLDENKKKYRDIYVNKLTRNIRNYYKNILETKFNEINNEHMETLKQLGLNISEEEISEDVELNAQLEEELNKLNDSKFKLFKKTQEDLEKILKFINIKDNKIDFFEYIINKYVISEKKFPFDFSSEYEKTKTEFNKNLKELLNEFSNMKDPSNNSNKSIKGGTPPGTENNAKNIISMGSQLATLVGVDQNTVDSLGKLADYASKSDYGKMVETVGEVAKNAGVDQNTVDSLGKMADSASKSDYGKIVETVGENAGVNSDKINAAKKLGTIVSAMATTQEPVEESPTNAASSADMDATTQAVKTASNVVETMKNAYIGTASKEALGEITKESQSGNNEKNLENFINKISQNLNENSNPNNINAAISKLQIMYAFQNKDYKTLINKYSKLSDSYHKLIKLEKINKIPITTKPAILTMIDKLFINNLTNTNENNNDDSEEEDDLNNYSNVYNLDDENSVSYKQKKSKKIVKEIEYKLFDGLNLQLNSDIDKEKNKSIAFNTSDGSIIN